MANFAPHMEIIYYNCKTKIQSECAATIGVFDGVHEGHQHVITHMKFIADFYKQKSMVITFDRQPRELFDPEFRPQLITTFDEKKQQIELLQVDYLVIIPFTMEIAKLTAYEFMDQVLRQALNVKRLVIGYDNRFGCGRKESFEDYENYGRELGIKLTQGISISFDNFKEPVSSSMIRRLIAEEGDVSKAGVLLGREYKLQGTVRPGEHIGTTLGFPTANLEPTDNSKLIPAPGVYAVWAILGNGLIKPAMMNIGTRPTFGGQKQTLEVNIFDYDGNLYDKEIIVLFVDRLRRERRFDSPEALIAQLEEDKKQVEQILNRK